MRPPGTSRAGVLEKKLSANPRAENLDCTRRSTRTATVLLAAVWEPRPTHEMTGSDRHPPVRRAEETYITFGSFVQQDRAGFCRMRDAGEQGEPLRAG